MSKPTVAILYGLGEGPQLAKRLKTVLRAHGFEVIPNASRADMILAHSGGMYALPDSTNKVVLLVAPSCGRSTESLISTQRAKVAIDFHAATAQKRLRAWLVKSWLNALYLFRHPRQLRAMWRKASNEGYILPACNASRTAVITYRNDPWSGNLESGQLRDNPRYAFISHTGIHDDLWLHPEEYVSVLQYLYES